ncbi:MAG: REP-associated tyrosine transposase, partial [Luteolibacter sp.]
MPEPFRHKGWHSRGYLPHLDAPGEIQALTFRLADALPAKVVASWKKELAEDPRGSEKALRIKIARYEDASRGSCLLRDPVCAEIVQAAFLHFHGARYRLLEWCVMPNHVHVLIHCGFGITLGQIVSSWKSYTAREIHKHTGNSGQLWALDYFDRYIRDLDHLTDARIYIRNNPVKAGLCQKPEDWPWSSAS